MKRVLHYLLLVAVVLSATMAAWSFDPKRIQSNETEEVEFPLTVNIDCTNTTSSNDLLNKELEIVGVFADYICVKADDEVWKVANGNLLWEFYSFEHDPYHNLTGRSPSEMAVGQYGLLSINPNIDGQYFLVGETFSWVYGTPEDRKFSKMWFGSFVPQLKKYARNIETMPLWVNESSFSVDFTPQDACYMAKEYSFAVRMPWRYSFCQYDHLDDGRTHAKITGAYINSSESGYGLFNVLPNKKDKPKMLEVGTRENELEFLGCFPIEGHDRYLATKDTEFVYVPYFDSGSERYYGSMAFTADDQFIDPVGVVFKVKGKIGGDVIPFHSLLEYNYPNGEEMLQTIYALPKECDPRPEKVYWYSWLFFWK